MPFDTWLAFFGASLVLSLAPGPDNIFVLMQSLIYGKSAGLKIISGLCTGLLVHTFLVTVGVSAIIVASPLAFNLLKIAGACYLVYLAFLAWNAPAVPLSEGGDQNKSAGKSSLALWRRGTIMNLTNPKVVIFFLAFFPQFISLSYNTPIQMIIMGLTFIASTMIVFGAIALFAEWIRRWIKSSKVQKIINRSGSIIFVGLAVSLLLV